jgi:hypothetical protein
MYHPSRLSNAARQRIIDQQAPVPYSFNIELETLASAYRGADLTVAYCGSHFDSEGKQIAASSRDRFYAQLRPLLAQLVVTH